MSTPPERDQLHDRARDDLTLLALGEAVDAELADHVAQLPAVPGSEIDALPRARRARPRTGAGRRRPAARCTAPRNCGTHRGRRAGGPQPRPPPRRGGRAQPWRRALLVAAAVVAVRVAASAAGRSATARRRPVQARWRPCRPSRAPATRRTASRSCTPPATGTASSCRPRPARPQRLLRGLDVQPVDQLQMVAVGALGAQGQGHLSPRRHRPRRLPRRGRVGSALQRRQHAPAQRAARPAESLTGVASAAVGRIALARTIGAATLTVAMLTAAACTGSSSPTSPGATRSGTAASGSTASVAAPTSPTSTTPTSTTPASSAPPGRAPSPSWAAATSSSTRRSGSKLRPTPRPRARPATTSCRCTPPSPQTCAGPRWPSARWSHRWRCPPDRSRAGRRSPHRRRCSPR